MQLWNKALLEKLKINVNLWFSCLLRVTLLLLEHSFLSHVFDDLLEDLMKNRLEHFPGIGDLVHYLAHYLKTEVHAENNLGIVSENLIL